MKFCDEKIQKHLLNGGKIKRKIKTKDTIIHIGDFGYFYDDKIFYNFSITDLTADDWEIVEPEYDWDKIIKDKVLCVFSDDVAYKINTITTLVAKDEDFYYTNNGTFYVNCKPFNLTDYSNIAKDIKEYEK